MVLTKEEASSRNLGGLLKDVNEAFSVKCLVASAVTQG